jgi:TrmH family RNA methyltransferase
LPAGTDRKVREISRKEMEGISGMISPQAVLALVRIPAPPQWPSEKNAGPVLAFDAIRDPGNLGTILRTADWFGVDTLLLSTDSVDLYNPKVVQASMGSITRVDVHYLDLQESLKELARKGSTVYGTFMKGEDLYSAEWSKAPVILFGNEARGISPALTRQVSRRLTIPSFRPEYHGPDSLNLAGSVAVVCSEIRRKEV